MTTTIDNINPNYRAYLKFNNLSADDENIEMYDFISWVNKKAAEFRKLNKLDEYHPISRMESWTRYIQGKE